MPKPQEIQTIIEDIQNTVLKNAEKEGIYLSHSTYVQAVKTYWWEHHFKEELKDESYFLSLATDKNEQEKFYRSANIKGPFSLSLYTYNNQYCTNKMSELSKYYSFYDTDQKRIILDEDDHCIVKAGAGSGKSTTMLGKIKYLVEEKHINSSHILMLSLTKATVAELKEKSKGKTYEGCDIRTFHSLGYKLSNMYHNSPYYLHRDKEGKEEIEELGDDIKTDDIPAPDLKTIIDKYFEENFSEKEHYTAYVRMYNYGYGYYKKTDGGTDHAIDCAKRTMADFISKYMVNGNQFSITSSDNSSCEALKYWKNLENGDVTTEPPESEEDDDIRIKYFLYHVHACYKKYIAVKQESTNTSPDYNMLINESCDYLSLLKKDHKLSPLYYEYIIIDEYQDISSQRFDMIQLLQELTGAKLCVVGDDWQAIYSFAGSRLDYFTNFDQYAGPCTRLYITTTHRNSQNLVDVATGFVKKNINQDQMKVRSAVEEEPYPIHVWEYEENQESEYSLEKRINAIYDEINHSDDHKEKTILPLARYGQHYEKYISEENKSTFKTIHTSKGLEADYVILLACKGGKDDRIYTFPASFATDEVLKLVEPVEPGTDIPDFAEERRIFYVALTRAKKRVYILVPNISGHHSDFVDEIVKEYLRSPNQEYIKLVRVSDSNDTGTPLNKLRDDWFNKSQLQEKDLKLDSPPQLKTQKSKLNIPDGTKIGEYIYNELDLAEVVYCFYLGTQIFTSRDKDKNAKDILDLLTNYHPTFDYTQCTDDQRNYYKEIKSFFTSDKQEEIQKTLSDIFGIFEKYKISLKVMKRKIPKKDRNGEDIPKTGTPEWINLAAKRIKEALNSK